MRSLCKFCTDIKNKPVDKKIDKEPLNLSLLFHKSITLRLQKMGFGIYVRACLIPESSYLHVQTYWASFNLN